MTASAQRDTLPLPTPEDFPRVAEEFPSPLKLEVAERLRAHRQRKSSAAQSGVQTGGAPLAGKAPGRRSNLAAAVAERYAQTPSYRAFLAEQAQRAMEEAAAAADVALRSAEAVAQAQQSLLAELELWNAPQEFSPASARAAVASSAASQEGSSTAAKVRVPMPEDFSAAPVREHTSTGLIVRLYEDAGRPPQPPAGVRSGTASRSQVDAEEALALDDEIAFRHAPVFDEHRAHREAPVPLAANLLEFPRQLIAARKARPRIAEGPLMDETARRTPQLRIFEVEAEHFQSQPSAADDAGPVQSFIFLDGHPQVEQGLPQSTQIEAGERPESASIKRRVVSLGVDAALVAASVGAFAVTAHKVAGALPAGMDAALTATLALAVFWVIYQMLFFTLSNQTPGMRMARIGLCTLSDDNPTRPAMRRRVLAQWIAILPFGIGMLWALLDDDRLGWHDRISQMYQRAY